MNTADTADSGEILAVVDTNVMVAIYSCRDYTSEREKKGGNDPNVAVRHAQARGALLLAIHFHEVGAITYSLLNEPQRILKKCVPPDARGVLDAPYTTVMVHFVVSEVLANWRIGTIPTSEEDEPKKEAADSALLEFARENDKAIITYDKELTERAVEAAVSVYTPEEYLRPVGADDQRAAERFLQRFRQMAPTYIGQQSHRENASKVLGTMDAVFRHFLMNEQGDG